MKSSSIATYPNRIMLIQNSFSTILLDAIQFFPENVKKVHAESHGLLFGNINKDTLECDYTFPVGNVILREKDAIEPNPKVDQAIKNAKQILSTSMCFGTYHSHPQAKCFKGWACPSNADVLFAKNLKFPFMIIIGISRNALFKKSLSIECLQKEKYKYHYDKSAQDHDIPSEEKAEGVSKYINGKFNKYQFEMHAYKYEDKCLQDIDLISSEADMLIELIKQGFAIEDLTPEMTYRLRKIEYDYRVLNYPGDKNIENARQNIDYHISNIKKDFDK